MSEISDNLVLALLKQDLHPPHARNLIQPAGTLQEAQRLCIGAGLHEGYFPIQALIVRNKLEDEAGLPLTQGAALDF